MINTGWIGDFTWISEFRNWWQPLEKIHCLRAIGLHSFIINFTNHKSYMISFVFISNIHDFNDTEIIDIFFNKYFITYRSPYSQLPNMRAVPNNSASLGDFGDNSAWWNNKCASKTPLTILGTICLILGIFWKKSLF